jgi:glycosyltransferase involved in cell wall biosynthesis
VTVATTDPSGKLQKEEFIHNVRIFRFRSWAPDESYYFSRGLKNYLTENSCRFDVLHAHNYGSFPALYAANAKHGNKFIFTPHYHGSSASYFRRLLHVPYKLMAKKIFEEAERVVFVSNFERDLAMKSFKLPLSKSVKIPNGLTLSEFAGLNRRVRPYRTILYVGRLEKYKGAQNIIRALPKMDKDIVLHVVGKGPFETDLVKLSSRLHLGSRVVFLKDLTRSELIQEYVDADLFVLLSEHEAYGICVAEALAAGTPCIVANTSALSEWVDNRSVFGINYPVIPDELVNCMKRVIGKTVDKPALQDWDTVAQETLKLYKDCSSRNLEIKCDY